MVAALQFREFPFTSRSNRKPRLDKPGCSRSRQRAHGNFAEFSTAASTMLAEALLVWVLDSKGQAVTLLVPAEWPGCTRTREGGRGVRACIHPAWLTPLSDWFPVPLTADSRLGCQPGDKSLQGLGEFDAN